MVIDMNYWTKVFRKLLILVLSLFAIYLCFKLAVFYMPFLLAFVISLLLEPAIRFIMKKCRLKRKTSAIIVMLIVIGIILGIKLIITIDNVNYLVGDITKKVKSLDNIFNIFDMFSNKVGFLTDTIANFVKNIVNKVVSLKKRKEEDEDYE